MDERTDDGDGATEADASAAPGFEAGLAQFQRAALDAVGAARALLDAAESVIRDPAAVEAVVGTVTAFARMATEAVADATARTGGASATGPQAADDAPPAGGPRDGFERITVD